MPGRSTDRNAARAHSPLTKLAVSATLALVAAAPCAADTLNVGTGNCFTSANDTAVFFDVTGKVPLTITRIDFYSAAATSNPAKVDIYTYDGTYVGNDGSIIGWTKLETIDTQSVDGTGTTPTPLPLTDAIHVDQGQTIGIALVARIGLIILDCAGATTDQDANLSVFSDRTRCCAVNPFAGTQSIGDNFYGVIHYDPHDHPYLGDLKGAKLGTAMATIGDVDGDDVPDIAIGAPDHDKKRGRVVIVSGNYLHEILGVIDGERRGDRFGYAVDGSDGKVIVGAPFYDRGSRKNAGKIYIYRFNGTVFKRQRTKKGARAGDKFGYSVATGVDVDKSGRDDFIVGAPYFDGLFRNSGAVFIYDEKLRLLEGISGENRGDLLGWSVDGVGKANSGGNEDFIAGAPRNDDRKSNAGKAYVYSGSNFATLHEVLGTEKGGQLGRTVAGVGKVNRDSRDDFAVGEPFAKDKRGRVAVYSGSNGNRLWRKNGRRKGDRFGAAIASAGNVNDDNYGDVIIGAPFYDSGGTNNVGRAYVRNGRNGGTLETFEGTKANDRLGSSVDALGLVGDRDHHTLLAGVPRADSGPAGTNKGRVFELPSKFVVVPLVSNPNLGGAVSADLNREEGRRRAGGEHLAATGMPALPGNGASPNGPAGAAGTKKSAEAEHEFDPFAFTVVNEFVNNGLLAPVKEGGVIVIESAFRQTAFGTTEIELAGAVPMKEYDVLLVDGVARLDGTLSVRLAEGFQPQAGESYRVLLAAKTIGVYAELDVPDNVVVRYEDDGVTLLVVDERTETVIDERSTDPAADLRELLKMLE